MVLGGETMEELTSKGYEALGIISSIWDELEERQRDYVLASAEAFKFMNDYLKK